MIAKGGFGATKRLRHASAIISLGSLRGSRTAAYRRLPPQRLISSSSHSPSTRPCLSQYLVARQRSSKTLYLPLSTQLPIRPSRYLHTSHGRCQQPRPTDDTEDPRRERTASEQSTEQSEQQESTKSDSRDEASEEKSEGTKEEAKTDEPAPPPHGDKSPWQVFTETLRSEFKASKEWNESTKQLASSAHQFSESDSVRKARAAYDATAGAATSKTAAALKTTGKALGQGAAWTWDTKMVQGIRGGVNATGRGIEKATRPVRETHAFQSIKEAVDDGSSSRYGGWVEKEERRKKKVLRDLKEVKSGRLPAEKLEEDPKYAFSCALFGGREFFCSLTLQCRCQRDGP
jgi:mitochondrial import inner membrane translocase subunit TIM44